MHLIWDCVVGIVPEIRGDFVSCGEHGGTRPARDVEDFLVGGLLGHLNGINCAHYRPEISRVHAVRAHVRRGTLVCTGSPSADLSLRRLKSFLAMMELGYVCCREPRLLTTSSAEYGLLIPSYRELAHQ